MFAMKTTIDIPDSVYREFKMNTARNGEKIRNAVIAFIVAYNAGDWRRPSAKVSRSRKRHQGCAPEWAGIAAPFITRFPEDPLDTEKIRDEIVQARKAGLK
jgi:hypothetical protein